MRYRENFADFITIGHAARLVQEWAGCSKDEARQDVIIVLQEFKLEGRARDIGAQSRKYYSGDYGLYPSLVRSLSADIIDWDSSEVAFEYVDSLDQYEIEVLRRQLEHLWRTPKIDAEPPTQFPNEAAGSDTVGNRATESSEPAKLRDPTATTDKAILEYIDGSYLTNGGANDRGVAIKAIRAEFGQQYSLKEEYLRELWRKRDKGKWPRGGRPSNN